MAASASSSELKNKALSETTDTEPPRFIHNALTETKDPNNLLSRHERHVDIDPHETLCWDVSIYTDVTFDQEPCEKCMPRLDTVRIPRQYKVCYK